MLLQSFFFPFKRIIPARLKTQKNFFSTLFRCSSSKCIKLTMHSRRPPATSRAREAIFTISLRLYFFFLTSSAGFFFFSLFSRRRFSRDESVNSHPQAITLVRISAYNTRGRNPVRPRKSWGSSSSSWKILAPSFSVNII